MCHLSHEMLLTPFGHSKCLRGLEATDITCLVSRGVHSFVQIHLSSTKWGIICSNIQQTSVSHSHWSLSLL